MYQLREFPMFADYNKFNALTLASGAVIIQKGKVLVVRESNEDYYSFPGGTLRANESLEQTAIREAKEELGVDVILEGSPFIFEFERKNQYASELILLFDFFAVGVMGQLKLGSDAHEMLWKGVNDKFDDCYENVEPTVKYFINQYGRNSNWKLK